MGDKSGGWEYTCTLLYVQQISTDRGHTQCPVITHNGKTLKQNICVHTHTHTHTRVLLNHLAAYLKLTQCCISTTFQ